uniref:Ig-like domain-containing protein n=1 Tax=Ustilaginoidea virens TaxID=1159556 RepID=A0A1X9WE84_USTVR|nr:hypothetical protein [Ustilaginoidea virens]
MYAAALAVIAAASLSSVAAQKYAPGKRNLCTKFDRFTIDPPTILWMGNLCNRNTWPDKMTVGNVQVSPAICCTDVDAYANHFWVIQGSTAVCRYKDEWGSSTGIVHYITKIQGTTNLYDVTVGQQGLPLGVDPSKTPGRYKCEAV